MGTSAETLVSPFLFPLYVMYFLEDKQQQKKEVRTRTEFRKMAENYILLFSQEVNIWNSKTEKKRWIKQIVGTFPNKQKISQL